MVKIKHTGNYVFWVQFSGDERKTFHKLACKRDLNFVRTFDDVIERGLKELHSEPIKEG